MKPIIESGGKVRGYEHNIGSRTEIIRPGGQVMGYYDHEKDQTILPGGRLFGLGDQTKRLIDEGEEGAH
jgi:hypothetical protein